MSCEHYWGDCACPVNERAKPAAGPLRWACPGCGGAHECPADPKPDELTVDDVLGVLRVAIAQHDVSLEGCTLALGTTGSVLVYTDGPGHAFEGTVAEAMAFAKRRGLLG